MIKEKKENAEIRLEDSYEFIASAKDNLSKERFKASIDHSVDACIAANDAFTIKHLEKIASKSHYEAIDLHRDVSKKFGEDKCNLLRFLLNTRHTFTYRAVKADKKQAEENFKKSVEFISWVKEHF